jgi:kumamolisin
MFRINLNAASCAVVLSVVATTVAMSAGSASVENAANRGLLALRHLGAINSSTTKYFTVNLTPATTAKDAELVAKYFEKFGLTVRIAPEHDILFVHGTYGQAGAAGHVGFERAAAFGDTFNRTTGRETYPTTVAAHILATTMNEGPHLRSNIVVAPPPGNGVFDLASYYDIKPVYAAGVGGKGETVDIAACIGPDFAGISAFESANGIPMHMPMVIPVDGGPSGIDPEPTLDAERVIGTAPEAMVDEYIIPDCSVGKFADMLAAIAASPAGPVSLNISYGLYEDDYDAFGIDGLLAAQDADIAKILAKGETTFVSTGDMGAFGDLVTGDIAVQFPASDDKVVAVGGTTAGSHYPMSSTRLYEYAWGLGGGGVSTKFPIPPFQKGLPGVASTTMRNIPDVALDADPMTGYEFFFTFVPGPPSEVVAGGTSASAPTWAALLALIDEKRMLLGKGPLTGVASALYKEATSPGKFIDIAKGTNGFYPAAKGYDNATGLGVPDVFKLYKALIAM